MKYLNEIEINTPLNNGYYILEVNSIGLRYIPFVKKTNLDLLSGPFHEGIEPSIRNLYHISKGIVDFKLDEATLVNDNNLKLYRIEEHHLELYIDENPELVI